MPNNSDIAFIIIIANNGSDIGTSLIKITIAVIGFFLMRYRNKYRSLRLEFIGNTW